MRSTLLNFLHIFFIGENHALQEKKITELRNVRFQCERGEGKGIKSGRNRETETKYCGRHVRATSETAIGHREKRNQLFKEHNRLLGISAFPIRLRYIGNSWRTAEKIKCLSCHVHHNVIVLIQTNRKRWNFYTYGRYNLLLLFFFIVIIISRYTCFSLLYSLTFPSRSVTSRSQSLLYSKIGRCSSTNGSYPVALGRGKKWKEVSFRPSRVNTLERRTHQGKKKMAGQLLQQGGGEWEGQGEAARKRWAFRRESRGEFEHDRLGPISRFSPDMPSAEWQMEAAPPFTRLRLSLRPSSVLLLFFLFSLLFSFSPSFPPSSFNSAIVNAAVSW